MNSESTLEMKLSMMEIVRIYQAVNDSIYTINHSCCSDDNMKKEYEALSKKLTKFMYDCEQNEQCMLMDQDEYEKENFKTIHISKCG